MLSIIKAFLKEYNELIAIPIGFLLWVLFPPFMRWLDPTAAPLDAGVFHIIVFALISFLFMTMFVWLFIKYNWSGLYDYLQSQIENDLWEIEAKQRLFIASAWYLGLFFIFALLVNALSI